MKVSFDGAPSQAPRIPGTREGLNSLDGLAFLRNIRDRQAILFALTPASFGEDGNE